MNYKLHKKRVLSFFLVLTFIITLLPLNVFARNDLNSDGTSSKNITPANKIVRQKDAVTYNQKTGIDTTNTEKNVLKDVLKKVSDKEAIPDKEEDIISDYFQIEKARLTDIQDKTHNIYKSVLIVKLEQNYEFTHEQSDMLSYLDDKTLKNTLQELVEFDKSIQNDKKINDEAKRIYLDLIIKGHTALSISTSYIIQDRYKIDFNSVLGQAYRVYTTSDIVDYNLINDEKDILVDIANIYGLNIAVLAGYCVNNNFSPADFDFSLDEKKSKETAEFSASYFAAGDNNPTQKYITAPFTYNKNGNENININTGDLSYDVTDVVIPGVNGFDFVLNRRYESKQARLYNPEFIHNVYYSYWLYNEHSEYIYKLPIDTIIPTQRLVPYSPSLLPSGSQTMSSYIENPLVVSGLSWSDAEAWYNFFEYYLGYNLFYYFEFENEKYANAYIDVLNGIYLSCYNTTTPTSKPNNTYEQSNVGIASGWSFAFSSIELDGQYAYLHTSDGSIYNLNLNNPTSMIIDHPLDDIKVAKVSTVFTNPNITTKYTLTRKDGYKEYFDSTGRIRVMEDKYGNKITFEYDYQPGQTRIVDTAGRVIMMRDVTESGVKKKIVDLPDGNSIEYVLDSVAVSGNIRAYDKLSTVTDQEGRETQYSYNAEDSTFTILGQSYNNKFINLTSITYPTGAQTKYNYEGYTKTLPISGSNTGTETAFRISTRYEIANSSSTDYKNKQTYTYSGNYTGYTTSSQPDPNNLPSNFTYSTTITDDIGRSSTYTFNNKHLNTVVQVASSGTNVYRKDTVFDTTKKLPTSITTTQYEGSNSIASTVLYEYDSKGNVTSYWNELSNGSTGDTEHKTTYTYDSIYNQLLTKSYKKDSSTTIVETNTLSTDKKSVLSTVVTESSAIVSKNAFTYDGRGNITEIRSYDSDNGFNGTYTSAILGYTDNVSGRTPSFDGVYLTSKTVTGVVDADGVAVDYYNGTNTGAITTTTKYDIMGRAIEQSDARGNITSYSYDGLSRVTQIINPDSTGSLYAFDDANNTLTHTNEINYVRVYTYDAFGNLSSVSSGTTTLATYEYDDYFRQITEVNADSAATKSTTYDELNRIAEVVVRDDTNTILSQEQYSYIDAYDTTQKLRRETKTIVGDANSPSIITHAYYDVMNRLVKQVVMDGAAEHADVFTYDYLGNKLTEKTAYTSEEFPSLAFTNSYEYNYAGKVTLVENTEGETASTVFDAQGNAISKTDFAGSTSLYTYDRAGRLIKEQIPLEIIGQTTYYITTKYYYDADGSIHKTLKSKGIPGGAEEWSRTDYTYDNRGQLLSTTSYDGALAALTTSYTYNGDGTTHTMTAGGKTTQYDYDSKGRLITLTDPMSMTEEYTYDDNDLLLTKTDRNGVVTTNTYDGLGRVLTTTAGTLQTSSQYTLTGKLRQTQNATATITYSYDSLGRMISEDDGSGVNTYTYISSTSLVDTSVLTDGTITLQSKTNEYDSMGRLEEVYENSIFQTAYTYDVNGNRASLTYANGNIESYTYNLANLVTSLSCKDANLDNLTGYEYTYYLDGNQRTKDDNVAYVGTEYTYDGLGRLTCEDETGGRQQTLTYTYDAASNRASLNAVGDKDYYVTYTYDDNNRLTSESRLEGGNGVVTNYNYDDNGNTLDKRVNSIIIEDFEYDTFNRMTESSVDGVVATYTYRPDGLRHSKTSVGDTFIHLWSGSNIVAELDGNGDVISTYLRGINIINVDDGTTVSYYNHNAHGDVVAMSVASGAVVKSYSYDAFGVECDVDDTDVNPFRYCGEYYDSSSGTYYLRNRQYRPSTGTFMQEDPARAGLNWYTYAGNNPILYIDPWGLDYYVYYGNDQEFAAQQYEKQLNKDYKGVPVHMIFVENPDVFYERWGAMGIENGDTVNIDGVIINLHGNPTNFYASDGKAIDLSQTSNERSIPTLLLLTCNGGNLDYDNNVAVQFLKAFNIGNVIASDGYHYRHSNYGFFGIGANVKNSVQKYDNDGNTEFIDKDRNSKGFVSFSLNQLGQVAYNFDVLNTMNGNKIRAVDLFKYTHHFAGGVKGLRG